MSCSSSCVHEIYLHLRDVHVSVSSCLRIIVNTRRQRKLPDNVKALMGGGSGLICVNTG